MDSEFEKKPNPTVGILMIASVVNHGYVPRGY